MSITLPASSTVPKAGLAQRRGLTIAAMRITDTTLRRYNLAGVRYTATELI
jgi:hypothetical protein